VFVSPFVQTRNKQTNTRQEQKQNDEVDGWRSSGSVGVGSARLSTLYDGYVEFGELFELQVQVVEGSNKTTTN